MYILLVLTIALLSAINITTGIPEVISCPACFPSECKNITCPEGQGLLRECCCSCCNECVIPEGGECWDSSTPSSSNSNSSTGIVASCEFGLTCCRGICSRSCCEAPTTESTTTESTTSESTTEPTISVT